MQDRVVGFVIAAGLAAWGIFFGWILIVNAAAMFKTMQFAWGWIVTAIICLMATVGGFAGMYECVFGSKKESKES